MAALKIRGVALPDGNSVELYADGDMWTTDPIANAELVGEGWILPGLVDVHTHPGAIAPGDALDPQILRHDLHRHVESGVALIRSPGLAADPPSWFGIDADVPRAVHAGRWIAQPGQFFDGWARSAELDDLPGVAQQQAIRSGWVKIIADWTLDDEPIPRDVLRAIVEAVHAVGGRVAVHSQHAEGGATAVAAGVDSIEHGMHLSTDLVARMAEQGTALTPTLAVFVASLDEVRRNAPKHRAEWFVEGTVAHPDLIIAAAEAGVTLLAGTDSHPTGTIADEIQALARTGIAPHIALGAGSWTARSYLGFLGLEDGGPADAVVYRGDPRLDLRELKDPQAIVLRGKLMYRAN